MGLTGVVTGSLALALGVLDANSIFHAPMLVDHLHL